MPARRSIRVVKLAIAVVSVINATAALAAAPKGPVRLCGAQVLAGDPAHGAAWVRRLHRPPRVPRRESYLHGEWRVGEW